MSVVGGWCADLALESIACSSLGNRLLGIALMHLRGLVVGVLDLYTSPWVTLRLFHRIIGNTVEPQRLLPEIELPGLDLGPVRFRVPIVINFWSLGCVRVLHVGARFLWMRLGLFPASILGILDVVVGKSAISGQCSVC